MVYKLLENAQKRWRRIRGFRKLEPRMESRLSINQTGTPLECHTSDLTITPNQS